jgi:uncharacterized protein YaiL (DUF2058 family)
LPSQYARVKNLVKVKEVIKNKADQTYDFVDKSLEEAIKNSSIYETDEGVGHDY